MKRAWPVFLVFLAMGFGDVVGPLVGLVKKTFELSNFTAQLLPDPKAFVRRHEPEQRIRRDVERQHRSLGRLPGPVTAAAGVIVPAAD